MDVSKEKFDATKNAAEQFYKTVKQVTCPYFQGDVVFNAKGLEHLKFKKKNHARSRSDQFIRFKLLKYAQQVLKLSRTVQGISEQRVFELDRSNHRNEQLLVNATFYEFVAVLDHVRVRVVVKQVENGPKYFWSIIPFWKNSKTDGKRTFHYGAPEYD